MQQAGGPERPAVCVRSFLRQFACTPEWRSQRRETILCSSGNRTVSSRASCGAYMRLNASKSLAKRLRSYSVFKDKAVAMTRSVTRRPAWCCAQSVSTSFFRFAEPRKEVILFELLVIILDELPDDDGS